MRIRVSKHPMKFIEASVWEREANYLYYEVIASTQQRGTILDISNIEHASRILADLI
jgi:hypothetical protein